MALLRDYSKASEVEKLPDHQGALAKDIQSSAISSANTEVQRILQLRVDPRTLACYLIVPPRRRNREQAADNCFRYVADNGTGVILHCHRVEISWVVHLAYM